MMSYLCIKNIGSWNIAQYHIYTYKQSDNAQVSQHKIK